MSEITPAGLRALRWLFEHSREGVLDRHGALIAKGERYLSGAAAVTWLRLFTTGHVFAISRNRIALTPKGLALAMEQPRLAPPADRVLERHERHVSPDPLGEYGDGEVGYVR